MGFFQALGDLVNVLVDSGQELGEILTEIREEGEELFTDGIYEMAIKDNNNYKTSYEKKDEAKRIIRAKEEELNEKYEKVNKKLNKLNEYIVKVNDKKRELAKKFDRQISIQDQNFYKINQMDTPKYREPNSWSLNPCVASLSQIVIPDCDVFDKFDFIRESNFASCVLGGTPKYTSKRDRVNRANEYLESANDYAVEVSKQLAELDRIEAIAKKVKVVLKEEEPIIDTLLGISIENSRFNTYARQLQTLLSESILLDNGELNREYTETVERLKCMLD